MMWDDWGGGDGGNNPAANNKIKSREGQGNGGGGAGGGGLIPFIHLVILSYFSTGGALFEFSPRCFFLVGAGCLFALKLSRYCPSWPFSPSQAWLTDGFHLMAAASGSGALGIISRDPSAKRHQVNQAASSRWSLTATFHRGHQRGDKGFGVELIHSRSSQCLRLHRWLVWGSCQKGINENAQAIFHGRNVDALHANPNKQHCITCGFSK